MTTVIGAEEISPDEACVDAASFEKLPHLQLQEAPVCQSGDYSDTGACRRHLRAALSTACAEGRLIVALAELSEGLAASAIG